MRYIWYLMKIDMMYHKNSKMAKSNVFFQGYDKRRDTIYSLKTKLTVRFFLIYSKYLAEH